MLPVSKKKRNPSPMAVWGQCFHCAFATSGVGAWCLPPVGVPRQWCTYPDWKTVVSRLSCCVPIVCHVQVPYRPFTSFESRRLLKGKSGILWTSPPKLTLKLNRYRNMSGGKDIKRCNVIGCHPSLLQEWACYHGLRSPYEGCAQPDCLCLTRVHMPFYHVETQLNGLDRGRPCVPGLSRLQNHYKVSFINCPVWLFC